MPSQNSLLCTCTTQVSKYNLDQQEEMATVLDVLRLRQSAINTHKCTTHLVARSYQHQFVVGGQRNNPCRQVGLLVINRKRAAQTQSFSCSTARIANPISLIALRIAEENEAILFFERTIYRNWSSRNANVKVHVRKKGNGEMCPEPLSEGFHPVWQTLKKAAP